MFHRHQLLPSPRRFEERVENSCYDRGISRAEGLLGRPNQVKQPVRQRCSFLPPHNGTGSTPHWSFRISHDSETHHVPAPVMKTVICFPSVPLETAVTSPSLCKDPPPSSFLFFASSFSFFSSACIFCLSQKHQRETQACR